MSVSNAEFAWLGGDRPGEPDFHREVPGEICDAIRRALAASFPPVMDPRARLGALRVPTGPVGRYRLTTPAGSWFVRVSSRWGHPELERAITEYLVRRGVSVSPLLVAGERLQWNGRVFRVDVRPLISGRHFDGSEDDLRSLAATLGACHGALGDLADASAVRAAASDRNRRLATVRDLIVTALQRDAFELFVEHAPWARAQRDWLAIMAKEFEPYLDTYPQAQCLHGEVHPGNVVFRPHDGAAVLIDFEESVHVFAPPAWDLAFLVQRFCLRGSTSARGARARVAVVADAYGRPLPPLAEMMRQAAWVSMATIVELRRSQGTVTPSDEYHKFVRLELQARALEGHV